MYVVFLVLYLLVALGLVFLIMLQHGNGIDIGGDSFNVYGSLGRIRGDTVSVMTRLTTVLGVLFFCLSLLLGNISNKYNRKDIDRVSMYDSLEKINYSEDVHVGNDISKP